MIVLALVLAVALDRPERAFAASAPALVPAAAAPFRREVRGLVLSVLASDLTLARAGDDRPFFSLQAFEAGRLHDEIVKDDAQEEMKGCTRRIDAVPLAWAGTLLSVRETVETSCPREAHPGGESRFVTFAVTAPATGKAEAKPVALTEWIAGAAVFESLRKDALVRAALASASEPPAGLDDLLAAAAESPPVVQEGKSCYAFPEDLLQRFAPSHLERGKLAVRLGLPGAAVCRDRLTELGILVPLPRPLAASLSAAATGRAGFLKKNAPKELAAHPTRIELKP